MLGDSRITAADSDQLFDGIHFLGGRLMPVRDTNELRRANHIGVVLTEGLRNEQQDGDGNSAKIWPAFIRSSGCSWTPCRNYTHMQWSNFWMKNKGCTKQKFSATQSGRRNKSTGVDSFVLFGGEGPKSQNFKF